MRRSPTGLSRRGRGFRACRGQCGSSWCRLLIACHLVEIFLLERPPLDRDAVHAAADGAASHREMRAVGRRNRQAFNPAVLVAKLAWLFALVVIGKLVAIRAQFPAVVTGNAHHGCMPVRYAATKPPNTPSAPVAAPTTKPRSQASAACRIRGLSLSCRTRARVIAAAR